MKVGFCPDQQTVFNTGERNFLWPHRLNIIKVNVTVKGPFRKSGRRRSCGARPERRKKKAIPVRRLGKILIWRELCRVPSRYRPRKRCLPDPAGKCEMANCLAMGTFQQPVLARRIPQKKRLFSRGRISICGILTDLTFNVASELVGQCAHILLRLSQTLKEDKWVRNFM